MTSNRDNNWFCTRREKADLVGVSYRSTPETGERLLGDFAEAADELRARRVRFAFGGTPPIAARAEALGFFEQTFEGSESIELTLAYLRGDLSEGGHHPTYPQKLIDRIHWKAPFPLLRHHFGRPTMNATIEGIRRIAESHVLDVISLGVDQDAQQSFFHPDSTETTGARCRWRAGALEGRL